MVQHTGPRNFLRISEEDVDEVVDHIFSSLKLSPGSISFDIPTTAKGTLKDDRKLSFIFTGLVSDILYGYDRKSKQMVTEEDITLTRS